MRKSFLFTLLILISSCFQKQSVQITTTYISCPIGNRKIAENIHDQECKGFVNQYFPHKNLKISDFNDLKTLKNQTGLDWQEIDEFDPYINFKELFDSCDNKVVHVVDIINSPKDNKNIVSIGSDDGFSLWVNGDSIATIKGGRNLIKNDNLILVDLMKGKNIIQYKVHNKKGPWALYRDYNSNISKQYQPSVNMYSNILEEYIIEDSCETIKIIHNQFVEDKLQNKLRSRHPEILIKWSNIKLDLLKESKYSELPETLELPNEFDKSAIFNVTIKFDNKIVYKEKVPVFKEMFIDSIYQELITYDSKNPTILAKQFAVETLFKRNQLNYSRKTTFSSRLKSEAIYDLFNAIKKDNPGINGAHTYGYKSPRDSTLQIYRVYYPENIYDKEPDDIVIYVPHIRHNSNHFYDDFMGNSHFYFRKLMEMSTLFNKIFVIPYGRGNQNFHGIAKEEIPIIINELSKKYERNDFNISYLTSSSGIVITSELLMNYDFPVKDVYAMAIKPNRMDREWNLFFKYLKNKQPDISFHIINGLADDVAPIKETRKWVKIAKKNRIKIEYVESEYLGHLLDLKLLQTTLLDKEWN